MTRKFKIILTVSVALNLLLAGVLGGMLCEKHLRGPGQFMAKESKLSEEGRAVMEEKFKASREDMRTMFRESRAAREDVMRALKADPFNADEYAAASARLQEHQAKVMRERSRVAGEVAASVSAEDRAAMAAWLARMGGPDKGGFRGKGPRGEHNHMKDKEKAPGSP